MRHSNFVISRAALTQNVQTLANICNVIQKLLQPSKTSGTQEMSGGSSVCSGKLLLVPIMTKLLHISIFLNKEGFFKKCSLEKRDSDALLEENRILIPTYHTKVQKLKLRALYFSQMQCPMNQFI